MYSETNNSVPPGETSERLPTASANGAGAIDDFAAFLAGLPDEKEFKLAIKRAQVLGANAMPVDTPQVQALALDFDAVPDPPDYVIDRVIERGTVGMFSGDTGAAKSIVSSSMIPAALGDDAWLGHATHIDRIMVVDEENPDRLATARLRAMGMTNDVADRLRYFSRAGIALGDGGHWDAWVERELEDFKPDLLIVDTLMAACAVEDTNSNSEAVRMMKFLRGLAKDHGCAILVLHHERKRSKEHPSSSGQAMMGARQWAGQADVQMTITVESDLIESEPDDDGTRTLRRTFKFRPAEKDRDGRGNVARRLAVDSTKDAAGRLLTMTVTDEGPITDDNAQEAAEAQILGALVQAEGDGVMTAAALAAATGAKSAEDGSFKRALKAVVEAEQVERPKRGHYKITEHGQSVAPVLDF